MNSIKNILLASSLIVGLAACSKSDDAKDAVQPIAPANPVEQDHGSFKTARQYKGSWRPLVSCTHKEDGSSVQFDFWNNELSYTTVAEGVTVTSSHKSPNLVGKPLGTDRVWDIVGAPLDLGAGAVMRLQIGSHGKGHILVRRSNQAGVPGWVAKYDCQENAVPYEQKFVQAACDGHVTYVQMFMNQYPDVSAYVNQIGVIGETALTCALKGKHFSVIDALLNRLDSGLDFSAGNLLGEMPLFIDMDGDSPRYSPEWLRRSDVDLNRVDGTGRTLLHTKHASISTLRALVASKRLTPALLLSANNQKTTGLGSLIDRNFNVETAEEALRLAKSVMTVPMDSPAIAGDSLLEVAIDRGAAPMAKLFLTEKPHQRLSKSLNGAERGPRLTPLAAQSCDMDFFKLLELRSTGTNAAKDVDLHVIVNNENAIDIIRRVRCVNADALIAFLSGKGVQDRLDIAIPACANNPADFDRVLRAGARASGKTDKVMKCVWKNPAMLEVMASHPNAGWDMTVIANYFGDVMREKDANLMNVYLNKFRLSASGSFISVMQSALNSGDITRAQYFDALVLQRVLNDSNLRTGAHGHLVFDLILDGDSTRVDQYLQSVSSGSWPGFDVAQGGAAAVSFYADEYKDLLANNGCTAEPRLTESLLAFSLRNGRADVAARVAGRMRSQRVSFGSVQSTCGRAAVMLMNPIHLAARQCATGVISQAYDLGNKFEGAGQNKMLRRTAWDVLARNARCTVDQVQAIAAEIHSTVGLPDDMELVNDGVHSTLLQSFFAGKGYVSKPVLAPYLSVSYPSSALVRASTGSEPGTFTRRDGRVVGGVQPVMTQRGSSGTWADYRVENSFVVSFQGLQETVFFTGWAEVGKKNGCLIISDSGAFLQMANQKLALDRATVCAGTLRFKFNPATNESTLPIKNHVNGEFVFSLDGLPDIQN